MSFWGDTYTNQNITINKFVTQFIAGVNYDSINEANTTFFQVVGQNQNLKTKLILNLGKM